MPNGNSPSPMHSPIAALKNLPPSWAIFISVVLTGGGATAMNNLSGPDQQVVDDLQAIQVTMAKLPLLIADEVEKKLVTLRADLRRVDDRTRQNQMAIAIVDAKRSGAGE